jgi:tRNA(His) 5'-end guanylyltransferase
MKLDERMRFYEQAEAGRLCMPGVPIMARLDGRNFASYTLGLEKPFDRGFRTLMIRTTRALVDQSGARVGYTQSDEITLLFYSDNFESQVYFNGKIQKMVSILASIATLEFNNGVQRWLPNHDRSNPHFDCRVWQVPTLEEAANCFLWREQDCTRNSVEMAARTYFSHKQLHGKNTKEMQEMLFKEHGVNWNDYEPMFKRGTYIQKREISRTLSEEEHERIPPQVRPELGQMVKRRELFELDLPPLGSIRNRVGVLVHGEPAQEDGVSET